jgi:hypothetical protein
MLSVAQLCNTITHFATTLFIYSGLYKNAGKVESSNDSNELKITWRELVVA